MVDEWVAWCFSIPIVGFHDKNKNEYKFRVALPISFISQPHDLKSYNFILPYDLQLKEGGLLNIYILIKSNLRNLRLQN